MGFIYLNKVIDAHYETGLMLGMKTFEQTHASANCALPPSALKSSFWVPVYRCSKHSSAAPRRTDMNHFQQIGQRGIRLMSWVLYIQTFPVPRYVETAQRNNPLQTSEVRRSRTMHLPDSNFIKLISPDLPLFQRSSLVQTF